ncbi:YigZ family protein [Virgibacillus halodenitrificans]|uniref:YigZ family protein n=1 Tax=Virgibacillus halodenitrificans TaxID=1482 RepID=UPI00045D09D9|nr:YigZ family protein [Virgibacillus halodenitrificans]MCJ0932588.1 YigZ family protein [Virgibacillus halodenitrificans]MEC2160542.1 YigZ family protein [Virgibacillus halodenitrificans]MYL44683.1 YigZ family protein [Virgibacillus halodenitrificans]WHX26741.1 YigZ family protein [Virgibacillus halodenitrificans]CDQ30845.1 IMPACT family member YigZ [Virgibacillus halodenitrificans]
MLEKYFTVKETGMDEIIIQKSKFIGYVRRVETEEAAQNFIQEIKKKHHDATHNCSAYMIGEHDQIQKANDDGEPSGTAGVPILDVLKKQQLKDTAVVVTRYFGGIKLGAGGLIRAYSSTTSQAIRTTGIVKRQLMQGFSLTIDYTLLGKLENELRQTSYVLDTINYLDKVELIVYVKISEMEHFQEWIINLTSDQALIEKKNTTYIEIDVESTSET